MLMCKKQEEIGQIVRPYYIDQSKCVDECLFYAPWLLQFLALRCHFKIGPFFKHISLQYTLHCSTRTSQLLQTRFIEWLHNTPFCNKAWLFILFLWQFVNIVHVFAFARKLWLGLRWCTKVLRVLCCNSHPQKAFCFGFQIFCNLTVTMPVRKKPFVLQTPLTQEEKRAKEEALA